MNTATFNNKQYEICYTWEDITLDRFIKLAEIEIPAKLETLWVASTKVGTGSKKDMKIANAAYQKASDQITEEDLSASFPEYYGKCMEVLSNIPPEVIAQIDHAELSDSFDKYLSGFVLTLIYSMPVDIIGGEVNIYDPEEIESFKLGKETYHFPKSLHLYDDVIPMAKEKVIAFAEAADIDLAISNLKSEGIKQLPVFMGIYCRKEGEQYDEDKALERAEMFKKANMKIVWTLFFLHRRTYSNITEIYTNVFKSGSGSRGDYNASGLGNFGWRGMIYEVGQSGAYGPVQEVEKIKLYEFMNYLSFVRSQEKLSTIRSKRMDDNRKSKRSR